MSLWKKEYQDKKYKYIDGENDTQHKRLKKKNKVKVPRAKHKHNYVNCVYYWYETFVGRPATQFYLGSYCDICGKIGEYHNDQYTPNNLVRRSWFFTTNYLKGCEEMEWTADKYLFLPADIFKQKFIDLDEFQLK